MGNTESNVTSGVKKQAGTSLQKLYKLIDLKGNGLLVDMMKRAIQNKQFAEIDHAIKTKVEPFLYNKGKGRYIPISHLVLLRNKERPRHKLLPPLRSMDNPDEEFDIEKDWPLVTQEEYDANPSGYRELCWDLKERGAVGETILHLCLLNATSLMADLAKRLLRFYPKLINDIYMSDEYYGESVLHMTIVNEDPAMVKFLLEAGADYQERCYGNFMCPEDQKASRSDSFEHEWVNVQPLTNYDGYVYWGEYPLSFAACLGQEECYRLILAKGADPNKQDTNGNTVLHMLVIYEKMSTFDMAYEVGASLYIRNVQNLTPLTLSAKLARVELFFHILNIEREIYWQIGATTCAAYPLGQVDTIDTQTGLISKDSALNLVVFGEKYEHLELLEGMLIDLLKTKWNTFVKFRFYRQFILFSFYFLVSLVCFTLRPGPPTGVLNGIVVNATVGPMLNDTDGLDVENCTLLLQNNTDIDAGAVETFNKTKHGGNNCARFKSHPKEKEKPTEPPKGHDMEGWWEDLTEECRLMNFDSWQAKVRISAEIILFLGALAYIGAALREARFLGLKMFFENLSTVPSRVMFLFSCLLMVALPTLRLWCADEAEDHLAVIIMLTTAPYFLFFCRGFKTVGPFVVMIYRMVMGDLLRFVCIYLVFVMGFSQAYYVIFLSFDNPNTPEGVDDSVSNPMPSPMESIMAMFLMSLTSFSDYYSAFERTDHEIEAKSINSSNLMKHLKLHKDEFKEVTSLNKKQKETIKTQNSEIVNRECTNLVTVHGRALALLDDEAFQNILALVPDCNVKICSRTIRNNILETAEILRNSMAKEFQNKMICVKIDIASLSLRSFMGINAQYLSKGTIVLKNLAMIELLERHTSEHLKEQVLFLLYRFRIGLENVYSFTTDNGANMLKMSSLLNQTNVQGQIISRKKYA